MDEFMTDAERQRLCEDLRTICFEEAADELERLAKENTNLWVIIRACQNDVLVAERERDEVLCRLKGTMQ
jgi:EAL domain-containing protein (putative c-di-GMP-specific phosphodiesterase class I)